MTGRKWWQIFPTYGNWGGPGWSSGFWHNDPALTDWLCPAIDYMDELFKAHDWAYQHPGEDLDRADRRLVHRLWNARPGTLYGKMYRIGAMALFTVVPVIRRLIWTLTK